MPKRLTKLRKLIDEQDVKALSIFLTNYPALNLDSITANGLSALWWALMPPLPKKPSIDIIKLLIDTKRVDPFKTYGDQNLLNYLSEDKSELYEAINVYCQTYVKNEEEVKASQSLPNPIEITGTLINQDLRGIDLSSIDLSKVVFIGCDLRLSLIYKNKTVTKEHISASPMEYHRPWLSMMIRLKAVYDITEEKVLIYILFSTLIHQKFKTFEKLLKAKNFVSLFQKTDIQSQVLQMIIDNKFPNEEVILLFLIKHELFNLETLALFYSSLTNILLKDTQFTADLFSSRDEDDNSLLHLASNPESIKAILTNPYCNTEFLTVRNKKGHLALMINESLFRAITSSPYCNAEVLGSVDEQGNTIFHQLLMNNKSTIPGFSTRLKPVYLAILLKHPALTAEILATRNKRGESCLIHAIPIPPCMQLFLNSPLLTKDILLKPGSGSKDLVNRILRSILETSPQERKEGFAMVMASPYADLFFENLRINSKTISSNFIHIIIELGWQDMIELVIAHPSFIRINAPESLGCNLIEIEQPTLIAEKTQTTLQIDMLRKNLNTLKSHFLDNENPFRNTNSDGIREIQKILLEDQGNSREILRKIQKIANERYIDNFSNKLKRLSFFWICPGRHPNIDELYRQIAAISLEDRTTVIADSLASITEFIDKTANDFCFSGSVIK